MIFRRKKLKNNIISPLKIFVNNIKLIEYNTKNVFIKLTSFSNIIIGFHSTRTSIKKNVVQHAFPRTRPLDPILGKAWAIFRIVHTSTKRTANATTPDGDFPSKSVDFDHQSDSSTAFPLQQSHAFPALFRPPRTHGSVFPRFMVVCVCMGVVVVIHALRSSVSGCVPGILASDRCRGRCRCSSNARAVNPLGCVLLPVREYFMVRLLIVRWFFFSY